MRSTGIDRGNAFWRGDDLNDQVTTTPDFHRLRQHSLGDTATLLWGDTLSLSGAYAARLSVPPAPAQPSASG